MKLSYEYKAEDGEQPGRLIYKLYQIDLFAFDYSLDCPPSYVFQVFYAQDMDGPETGETFADYNREPTTSSSAVVDDVMTESSDESGTYSK